jgi:hypothetical protein
VIWITETQKSRATNDLDYTIANITRDHAARDGVTER